MPPNIRSFWSTSIEAATSIESKENRFQTAKEKSTARQQACARPPKIAIDFRTQAWSKRCLELRSIARSTASNTRNRWAGLGRLFVTLIRIGGMADPTRSLRLLVRYTLFLLTLKRRTPFTRFTAAYSSPATDMDEQRRPLPARARRTMHVVTATCCGARAE